MTVPEFTKAFEIVKTAYPTDMMQNADYANEVRLQVLKQMTERMILLERAGELHIEISDAELEAAVADIKKGYPEGMFKKVLIESAISFDSWKNELKIRLLMEKVIARELGEKITITSEEIANYREEHHRADDSATESEEKTEDTNEMLAGRLYREKTEEAYHLWIKNLRKNIQLKSTKRNGRR